jgi:hypothetical protein
MSKEDDAFAGYQCVEQQDYGVSKTPVGMEMGMQGSGYGSV